jgi:hypothetical protein
VQLRSGARDRTSISTFRAWRPAWLDDPGANGCNASPSIPRTGDRRSRRAPVAGDCRVFMSRPAVRRTMLSMPLAYPSTLDHRPPIAQIRNGRRPTWRGVGARAQDALFGKRQAKANAYCQRLFRASNAEIFLSQAGPRFDLELVQAEHHLWFRVGYRSPSETKKATQLGRPRLAQNAARGLARIPRSEGKDVTGPALRIEAAQARRGRHGGRRFGMNE